MHVYDSQHDSRELFAGTERRAIPGYEWPLEPLLRADTFGFVGGGAGRSDGLATPTVTVQFGADGCLQR